MTIPPLFPTPAPSPAPQPAPAPGARVQTAVATMPPEGIGSYSVDKLYDFFDFFDRTVEDVYAYVLHCTRVPELVPDIVVSVYFSLQQRSRFTFWKSVTKLSTLLALADKAISSMRKWEEEATGYPYLEELLRCGWDGRQQGVLERMRMFLQAFRKLPVREQKIAVLQFFLQWPASKTASIVGRSREHLEQEYGAVAQLLTDELQKQPAFRGADPRAFLASLRCPPLDEQRKTALRLALLERCRSAQMSSLRFVLPIAAGTLIAGTAIGCILLFATVLLPALTAKSTLEQIAAAEVLLLGHEIAARDAFVEAEQMLRGITAYVAEKNLAQISLQLAPLAVSKQVEQERTIGGFVRELGFSSLGLPQLLSLEQVWARGGN